MTTLTVETDKERDLPVLKACVASPPNFNLFQGE